MKVQAINNNLNFGARIKINKKITQGLYTDSLISSEGIADGMPVSAFFEPVANNKSGEKLAENTVKDSLIQSLWNKYIKKIPS